MFSSACKTTYGTDCYVPSEFWLLGKLGEIKLKKTFNEHFPARLFLFLFFWKELHPRVHHTACETTRYWSVLLNSDFHANSGKESWRKWTFLVGWISLRDSFSEEIASTASFPWLEKGELSSIDRSVCVCHWKWLYNSSSLTCTAVRQKRERTQCDGKWPISSVHIRSLLLSGCGLLVKKVSALGYYTAITVAIFECKPFAVVNND